MLGKLTLIVAILNAASSEARPNVDEPSHDVTSNGCPPDVWLYLLPHETDWDKFYYCEYGVKWEQASECPPGKHFDFELQASAATKGGSAPLVKMNNGRFIPQMSLGTFLGWDENGPVDTNNGELERAVGWAIDAGYRHFDTAAIYHTEEQLGRGLKGKILEGAVKREDIFVTTKLWNDKHGRDEVIPALKDSLKKLDLEYVDLYLMHWPVSYSESQEQLNIDPQETWKGMEEAHQLGLAKSIGVSNFNRTQLQRMMDNSEIKPAVLQIEVNPNFTNEELVGYAQAQGLVVMAYSPFGSLIALRSTADSPPPKIDDPVLTSMGKKYGKTTPQVVLRYLVERGLVPVPKSITKSRIEQNIDVFDFTLTPEEVAQVASFNKDKRIVLPSFWQDHPEYPFEKLDKPMSNPF